MGTIEKISNLVTGSRVFDALQSISDRLSGIKSGIQGWAGTVYTVAANGSTFIGLNRTNVKDVTGAIEGYVKAIQSIAEGLNERADTTNAVRGDIVAATQKYLIAIKDVLQAYISQLLAYADKMVEYANAYTKNDTSLASNVETEATSLAGGDGATEYTRTTNE